MDANQMLAIALGGLSLVVVVLIVVVVGLRQQFRKLQGKTAYMEVELRQLREQLNATDLATLEMTSVLDEVSAHGSDSPYAKAISLVNQGYGAEVVAAQCGISRGEADLIISLYKSNAG